MRDPTGFISLDEFAEACELLRKHLPEHDTKEQLLDMCKMMDINKDGLVDLNEFLETFRLCEQTKGNYCKPDLRTLTASKSAAAALAAASAAATAPAAGGGAASTSATAAARQLQQRANGGGIQKQSTEDDEEELLLDDFCDGSDAITTTTNTKNNLSNGTGGVKS